MEYSSPQSFERLTGLAFFTPAGQAGAIPFGNIEMVKCDYGTKSIDVLRSLRGTVLLSKRDTYQAVPIFSIDLDQTATPLVPLLLLGTPLANFSQGALTGNTFTFTAARGLAFAIGAYNLSSVVVTVSAVVKTLGTDYFLDPFNGMISLPVVPAGIADGNIVTVTFNQPALTMEQYKALTQLSIAGALVIFAEDEFGPPAKEIWSMTVALSCKKPGDIDPSKFRKFTLEAALIGNPIVLKRAA